MLEKVWEHWNGLSLPRKIVIVILFFLLLILLGVYVFVRRERNRMRMKREWREWGRNIKRDYSNLGANETIAQKRRRLAEIQRKYKPFHPRQLREHPILDHNPPEYLI